MTTRNVRGEYHLACPMCDGKSWQMDDLPRLANILASHWNREHGRELKHSMTPLETVDVDSHHLHGNDYNVTRYSVYLTSFDVLKRAGAEDSYAHLGDPETVCPECLCEIPREQDRIVIEERHFDVDDWICRACLREQEIEQRSQNNQSLEQFAT